MIDIFQDKKAFDIVNHTILIKKYIHMELGAIYLINRPRYVTYNEKKTDIRDVTCGVP